MSTSLSDFGNPQPAGKHNENNRSEARIAFRTLAPKAPDPSPRPLSIRSHSTPLGKGLFTFRKPSDRCQVCFKIGCHLISHKYYGTSARTSNTGLQNSEYDLSYQSDPKFVASYTRRLGENFDPAKSPTRNSNVHYDLPLSPEMNTIGIHKLFHHCVLHSIFLALRLTNFQGSAVSLEKILQYLNHHI